MTAQRHVNLRHEHRVVALPGEHDVLSYTGVTVDRIEGGRLVDRRWVPTGNPIRS